ncbi:hypothetical protein D3C79_716990 [compost metagenome]
MLAHHVLERGVDVLGHAPGVTTDIEVSALLQPAPQVSALLEHALLYIDFLRLVTGEGGVQAAQVAVALPGQQFVAVIKITGGLLLAEQQPVAPTGSHRLTFLKKSPKRRNPRAWADHDHRRRVVCRQTKMAGRLREDRHPPPLCPVGQVTGAHALALAITDGGQGQVNLFGMCFLA